jgi:hypothetical protein
MLFRGARMRKHYARGQEETKYHKLLTKIKS